MTSMAGSVTAGRHGVEQQPRVHILILELKSERTWADHGPLKSPSVLP